jgi:hypothetical protein
MKLVLGMSISEITTSAQPNLKLAACSFACKIQKDPNPRPELKDIDYISLSV